MAAKTLEQIKASRPTIDRAKIAATTEGDIRRYMIEDGEDPDAPVGAFVLAPQSLRHRLNMTQEEFAAALHVPVATLRNWEQGRVALEPAVVSLLTIVTKHPKLAFSALRDLDRRE